MFLVLVIFSLIVIMWWFFSVGMLFSCIVLWVYCCGYSVFDLFCVCVLIVMLCWLCVVLVEMWLLLFSSRFSDI